jgi:hypothetical protein
MSQSRKRWGVGGLLLILSALAHQASAQDTQCPPGFERIPSGLACAAVNLAGADGTYAGLVAPVSSTRTCPEGFERPPGVNFCVATRLTLNAIGALPILEARTSRFCPEGFHRPPGVRLCIASNLVVKTNGSSSVLEGPSGDDCPVGFYKPVGSTICVAENERAATRELERPVGSHCPPGFHRPPGVTVCIARNLLFASTLPANIAAPVGMCPRGWIKPPGVNFCIPTRLKAPSAGGAIIDDFIPNPCPSGTYEVWFDMPVYDEDGLFVVDYVPTRFCVSEGTLPAG